MKTNESLELVGIIEAILRNAEGMVIDYRRVQNVVTNTGRQLVIDRLQAASPAVCDYIAIGTNSTSAAAADTTLGAEAARAQGTLSQPDAYTDRCVYNFGAGVGTGTITECGRLNAGSGGTLMGRQVFPSIVKGAGDSLQITYDFTYAAG